ncbi:MAG: lactonase family protein [Verrucomicrobiota bacterium]|jgi:6-phosphogluconolactonase
MKARKCLACLLSFLGFSVLGADETPPPPAAGACLVYAGTYTGARSKGIYAWRMDLATGSASSLGLVAETPNPTFLQIAPNHRFLYAVNEVDSFEGKAAGSVSAFSVDAASGKLTFLNQQTSGGRGPCHLTLDREGKNVLVANYNGGSIECLPIQSDGRLGPPTSFIQHSGKSVNPQRQEGPHAHCMTLDAADHFVFVCDLGLDKIMSYRFDISKGTLVPSQPAFTATTPGAGPRHLVFYPDGRQACVINELNSTIVRYAYDGATGALTERQTVALLPQGFTGASTAAEIAVHPSGNFLYGSNRGDDSIAVFSTDAATGNLAFVQRVSTEGKTPRNFTIDPSGKLLFAANQNSDNIVVFNIDAASGKLAPSGQVLEAPSPVCIQFVPVP